MAGLSTTRQFTEDDQELFARLSGDRNPMHLDAVAARRTQAGARVVHGIHAVLWALDTLSANEIPQPIANLKVEFKKFIYLDCDVVVRVGKLNDSELRADILVADVPAATVRAKFGQRIDAADVPSHSYATLSSEPTVLSLDELEGMAGSLPLRSAGRFFPYAAEQIGIRRVEALAQLSSLVGMVCPGQHSMFAGFDVAFTEHLTYDLAYRVESVDKRFRRVVIAVNGGGIQGTVTAFVRYPPVAQPTFNDVKALVPPSEFSGTAALIIGGSRGLGALTTRLITAGGGRAALTYVVGEAEAKEVANEVGGAPILQFDARKAAQGQLAHLDMPVNQLYYFATTQIFKQKTEFFSAQRYREFSQIYVEGFYDVCAAMLRRSGKLTAFYPSSVAVDSGPRELIEYSAAKAAGELLCAEMNRHLPGIQVLVRRLPRILTDQTVTMASVETADPVSIMLPILLEMHGRHGIPRN